MIGENKLEINTEFPTGNLDDFMSEMIQPKQNMDIDERPLESEAFEQATLTEEPEAEIQMKAAPARATAKLIVNVIDNTIPATLGIVAKEESTGFKASPDERSELVEAMTEYVRLKGGDVPPGVMVMILICTIYGSKVPYALQQRKLNTMREELQEQQAALDKREAEIAEREALNRQIQEELLSRKVQQVETVTETEETKEKNERA